MERVIAMSTKELSRLDVMLQLQRFLLSQAQAADILGISVRQVKRLWKAFKEEGAKGLISKKQGSKGNHRLPEEVKKGH
ncbi:MAG: hypothetical protein KR126chlam3_00549 [Chlamydiae bacterium]|nr:hypothetical protein [Chlamydiota bacterium]